MADLFKAVVVKAVLGGESTADGKPKRATVKWYFPTRPLATPEEYAEYESLNAAACVKIGLKHDALKFQNDGAMSGVRNKLNVMLRKAYPKVVEEGAEGVAVSAEVADLDLDAEASE